MSRCRPQEPSRPAQLSGTCTATQGSGWRWTPPSVSEVSRAPARAPRPGLGASRGGAGQECRGKRVTGCWGNRVSRHRDVRAMGCRGALRLLPCRCWAHLEAAGEQGGVCRLLIPPGQSSLPQGLQPSGSRGEGLLPGGRPLAGHQTRGWTRSCLPAGLWSRRVGWSRLYRCYYRYRMCRGRKPEAITIPGHWEVG